MIELKDQKCFSITHFRYVLIGTTIFGIFYQLKLVKFRSVIAVNTPFDISSKSGVLAKSLITEAVVVGIVINYVYGPTTSFREKRQIICSFVNYMKVIKNIPIVMNANVPILNRVVHFLSGVFILLTESDRFVNLIESSHLLRKTFAIALFISSIVALSFKEQILAMELIIYSRKMWFFEKKYFPSRLKSPMNIFLYTVENIRKNITSNNSTFFK
jgi:hypothetical protein